jgi:hypothetical protein
MVSNGNEILLFYHEKLVFRGEVYLSIFSIYNEGEYLYLYRQTSSDSFAVNLFFRDENIYSHTGSLSGRRTGLYVSNFHAYLMVALNPDTQETRYIVFYEKEIIDEIEGISFSVNSNFATLNKDFLLLFQDGSTRRHLYYRNQKILDVVDYNIYITANHYLTVRLSDGYFELFFGLQKIEAGIVPVAKDAGLEYFVGYSSLVKVKNTRDYFYNDKKIYENGKSTNSTKSGEKYFFIAEASNSKTIKGFYNGEQIYDGAVYTDNYVKPSESVFYCNDFAWVNVSKTHTILFYKGIMIHESVSVQESYLCCGNKIYLTYNENNTAMIDVLDTDFGRMKFDLDTFERLA